MTPKVDTRLDADLHLTCRKRFQKFGVRQENFVDEVDEIDLLDALATFVPTNPAPPVIKTGRLLFCRGAWGVPSQDISCTAASPG